MLYGSESAGATSAISPGSCASFAGAYALSSSVVLPSGESHACSTEDAKTGT